MTFNAAQHLIIKSEEGEENRAFIRAPKHSETEGKDKRMLAWWDRRDTTAHRDTTLYLNSEPIHLMGV